MDKEYPLHKGARSALNITGVLCCLLVVGIPLGIWIFVRAAAARVFLRADELKATNVFSSTGFAYRDVARLGTLRVAVVSGGGGAGGAIGGALARQKVGGDHATHLVAKLADGKTRSVLVSSYENMQEIVDEVAARTGKPLETLTAGALGVGSAKGP
jgi:hypothetical protein